MTYQGYLSNHILSIRHMSSANLSPLQIALELYAKGVRSPHRRDYWKDADHINAMAAMVGYVLRPPKKKTKARWHVWTPQMQAEEFDRELADYE